MERVLDLLTGAGRLLPATVVAAIILFAVKEALEAKRRGKANARKRKAIRRLIADEIERNNWTIKSLRQGLFQIERHLIENGSALSILVGALGERYVRREEDGIKVTQFPVGKVHTDALSANLMALAEIDETIFDEALEASDAMKELDHVLKSMVEQITNYSAAKSLEEIVEARDLLEGFVEYAREVIEHCDNTFRNFYKNLTGQSLQGHRVR